MKQNRNLQEIIGEQIANSRAAPTHLKIKLAPSVLLRIVRDLRETERPERDLDKRARMMKV